ncbi:MAG: hypothetical protein CMB50_00880 [Euryarchaeota archaeon]|nr:hypothetical protein [Euryarchaeota archaeon]
MSVMHTQASKVDLEERPLSSREEVGSAGWRVRIGEIFPRQPASASEILLPSEDGFQIPAGLTVACASVSPRRPCQFPDSLPDVLIAIGDGFLFTSSRFELLQTSALRGVSLMFHTSPPGFPSSCDSVPPGEGVGSTD